MDAHDNRTQRPSLDSGEHRDAITHLIDHLQRGHDTGDADLYDGLFADDILWGSPKGQVLQGFAPLNAIHHTQLTGAPASPASVFELAQASAPTDDVVIAQIRRRAINGGFSETAMYVLVRRDDRWWLAGGHNTPITDVLPAA